ncbi:MAG: bifunctional 23S rRNA (guanine(2069)-N(7))-methyltransferase RlmK/23S rRNA (guanine(2445)-N(2))-methyltransferase RlmL [Rhodocyclaceae bacterium]|nr:bifunctional 23S rRNA (guanine(2069)-N(7))-methyltransferase RlmK/23S rRNA (guanine(2445)-N(2))-methyltransferase RlmL [Rhodocyclaceae bacterium]
MSERFFSPCPRGLEGLLADELTALGASAVEAGQGGVAWQGDWPLAQRANLESRLATRVLWQVAEGRYRGEEDIYRLAYGVTWAKWFTADETLRVYVTSQKSPLKSLEFVTLRVKDAVCDHFRTVTGKRPSIDTREPDVRVHAFLTRDGVSLYLDTSGEPLYKRGFKRARVEAPLKENLAAGLLRWAGWPQIATDGGAFVDPMAGAGTLAIEAACMVYDVAPGLRRERWGFSRWRGHDADAWTEIRRDAEQRARAGVAEPGPEILAYDGDAEVVERARANVGHAGLGGRLSIETKPLRAWLPGEAPAHGLLALNPPYGERLGDKADMRGLYGRLGRTLLRCFGGWQGLVLTSDDALRHAVGLVPQATLAVSNGPLRCTALRYAIPERPEDGPAVPQPSKADRAEAAPFLNRLRKNLRARRRWAEREGISCYRLYDADVPEFNVAIDRYDRWLHVQEYEAPSRIDPELAARRLDLVVAVLPEVLGVAVDHVVLKRRRRSRGRVQYRPLAATGHRFVVEEGGHRFWVNLHDYLDTGLFLDHRLTRAMIEQRARGKRFLNLFAYTGSATVYAAAGGAKSTTTVDLSNTYLEWAEANLELNGLTPERHRLVRADVRRWLEHARDPYDLVFLDPPTTSTSKAMDERFEVGRDHLELVAAVMERLAPGGELLLSANARRFVLAEEVERRWQVEDLTAASLPPDFRREPPIHRLWSVRPRGG